MRVALFHWQGQYWFEIGRYEIHHILSSSFGPPFRIMLFAICRIAAPAPSVRVGARANDDYESAMKLVNIHSHAETVYTISMIACMSSFPVVCLCVQPLEDNV